MHTSLLSSWYRKPTLVLIAAGLSVVVITLLLSCQDINCTHGLVTLPRLPQPLYAPSQSSGKKHVLLITYGRSGSSFTSALISRHPDVFCTYEPLFLLEKGKHIPQIYSMNTLTHIIFAVKQTYRPWDGYNTGRPLLPTDALEDVGEDLLEEILQIMRGYFTCKFSTKQFYALDNSHHRRSDDMKNFYTCLRSNNTGAYHFSCYVLFMESCESHKTTFIKTIRFRMGWAEKLLEEYPNLKVLYLMRDPRAVLYSQAQVFGVFSWKNESIKASRTHCGLIQRDLTSADRLRTKYPGRIMGIRYEEGATNPFRFTKKIYTFLGLDFNQGTVDYIQDITNSKTTNHDGPYNLVKQNSTQAMNKWRYSAGYNTVHKIDEVCKHLYDSIGYETVRSQSHLESVESLVQTPKSGGIFD